MPPLADAQQYRELFYAYVFEGRVVQPSRNDKRTSRTRSRVTPAQRRHLDDLVAADRADPRKAEMAAASRQRMMERSMAAEEAQRARRESGKH